MAVSGREPPIEAHFRKADIGHFAASNYELLLRPYCVEKPFGRGLRQGFRDRQTISSLTIVVWSILKGRLFRKTRQLRPRRSFSTELPTTKHSWLAL